MLLAFTPPFLSESSNPNALKGLQPLVPAKVPPTHPPEYTQCSQQISHLLLSQTFLLHLGWIVGLAMLSTVALVDVLMKIVFMGCRSVVCHMTPESL